MIDFVTAFLGRFHPLLVHLPIGILFLAFLFECFSLTKGYKTLKNAVQPALFCGSIFAIASAVSGYFLKKEGGYEENLLDLHQNFGIATAIWSVVVYVSISRLKFLIIDPVKRKKVRVVIFIPLILLLSITGHWGGSLTHGEDYLVSAVSITRTETVDPTLKIKAIANIPDAILYPDVIQPILEARCYECHSARKQKGEFRLDKEELIERGGKSGVVISHGIADSSSIYTRLMLPLEAKHHMPPNEKPQLSSSEIALIKYWIEEKPLFNKRVSQFKSGEKISAIIKSLQEPPRQSWIPLEPVGEVDERSLRKMNVAGLSPIPLAQGSNYLMVNFSGAREIRNEQINSLLGIKDQLIWLDLSNTGVTDEQLKQISNLNNLRVVYLNYTRITDSGLSELSSIPELRFLNLVGTQVTDKSIPLFLRFEKLASLFLYQTLLSKEGIQQLSGQQRGMKIDTGNYILKKLPSDTIIYKKISLND